MALLNGIFNANMNPAELNKRSFAASMLRLFPNGSAPLFALTSQSGKSTAVSSTHGYFSKTMTFIATTSPAGNTASDTVLGMTSNAGMTANMVLFNVRTRENVRITGIPTGSVTVEVSRAFGRIAAATVNATDKWVQVGTAFAENSLRPAARSLATTYIPNFTQIFRNAWGLSNTARATMSEMGYSNIAESKKDAGMFHSVDIEGAIIWGQPKMDTSGDMPIHATQGILDAIEQYAPANTNTAGATTTFAQLVTLLEPGFQYSTDMSNAKTRTLFGDSQAIKVINDIGRLSGQVYITQNETSFGMNFTKFKFYKGEINMIEHPLMNGMGLQGVALVMDMPALKLAYLDGRDTKAEEYGTNGQIVELGTDGVGGSLTTELAVELINPYSCCYIDGLTAAAA